MPGIYVVQMNIAYGEKERNYARVRELLSTVSVDEGSLILLPEFFATGFAVDPGRFKESFCGTDAGPTAEFLSGLSRSTRSWIIANGVAPGKEKLRNRETVFSPDHDGEFAYYEKIHPYTTGGEHLKIEGGKSVSLFTWNSLTVSPLVCYDLRFPEPFRAAAFAGAHLMTVSASWPAPRDEFWQTLLRARAMENQAVIAASNRVGSDPYHSYMGNSVILSPEGRALASAGTGECVISAEVSLEMILKFRGETPILDDAKFRGSLPPVRNFG